VKSLRRRLPALGAVAVVVVTLLMGQPAAAQTPAPGPLATLGTWADNVWMSLLDRDGGWAGRLSDAGILQRFNPDEDTEYRIDMHTSLFTPSEDARWASRPMGLRGAAGSLSRPELAQRVEWRQRFVVSGGWSLEGDLVRERTWEVFRDHLRTGIFWQPGGTGSWEAGATLGLHFFKPSADVELLLRRRWGEEEIARGWIDVRFAVLDAFNDVVFQALGVSPEAADAHFDYLIQPVALRADGSWKVGIVRLEIRSGVSRRSTVRVTFPAAGDPPYELGERVAFAGGVVELQATPSTTVAALASVARAETERLGDTASTMDLSLRETTRAAGLRARQTLSSTLALEADFLWTERPEQRSTGWRSNADPQLLVEHQDRELFGGFALVRRPLSGWTGRLFYGWLDRNADPLMSHLTKHHIRLITDAGYRFASGFEVTAGVRWQMARRAGYLFSGGQLRFTTGVP
jgi:hypothetical protein